MDGPKIHEVNLENGVWKSYKLKDSITKTFITDVDAKMLGNLIKIINAKDTSINLSLFQIKPDEFSIVFDSFINDEEDIKNDQITPAQRNVFREALSDQKILEKYLRNVLNPLMMDDASTYIIKITMNSGETKKITATSFANIYDLPWIIDEQEIHNPDISRIFSILTGFKEFDKMSKDRLYRFMLTKMYWLEFQAPFIWENLQDKFPSLVKQTGGTLKLEKGRRWQDYWATYFSSSLVSKQITMSGGFKQPDTIVAMIKKLERKLVGLKQKNHYFFRYVQSNPYFTANTYVSLQPEKIPAYEFYNELSNNYKELFPYKFEDVLYFELYHKNTSYGNIRWFDYCIILPNNTLVILPRDRSRTNRTDMVYVYSSKGDLIKTLPRLGY